MKIKKTTRLISFILVVFTILSIIPFEINPLEHLEDHIHDEYIAYADQTGYVGGGAGIQGYGSKHLSNWSANKQGIRFSIVNADMKNVMNSSVTGYTAIDFIFTNLPDASADVKYLSGNKFEGYGDGSTTQYKVYELNSMINKAIDEAEKKGNETSLKKLDTYQGFTKQYKGLPLPVKYGGDNQFAGNGEAVRDFFIKGELSDTVIYYSTYVPTIKDVTGNTNPSGGSEESGESNVGGGNAIHFICLCCNQSPCIGKSACKNEGCTCLAQSDICHCCNSAPCKGFEAHNIPNCTCKKTTPTICSCCKQQLCLGIKCTNVNCTCSRTPTRSEIEEHINEVYRDYLNASYETIAATGRITKQEKERIQKDLIALEKVAQAAIVKQLELMRDAALSAKKDEDKKYWQVAQEGTVANEVNNAKTSYKLEDALNGLQSYESVVGGNKLLSTVAPLASDLLKQIKNYAQKHPCFVEDNPLKTNEDTIRWINAWIEKFKNNKIIAVSSRVNTLGLPDGLAESLTGYALIPLADPVNPGESKNSIIDEALASISDKSSLAYKLIEKCKESNEGSKAVNAIEAAVNSAYSSADKAELFWNSMPPGAKSASDLYANIKNAEDVTVVNTYINLIKSVDKNITILISLETSETLTGTSGEGINVQEMDPDEYRKYLDSQYSKVDITVVDVKIILNNLLRQIRSNGFNMNYEDLLGLIEGNTEINKLLKAVDKIKADGLETWLLSIDISSLYKIYDDGSNVLSALYSNEGYIGAILDMRDPVTGKYLFNLKIDPALKEDYEKACQLNGVESDIYRPSRIFSYCGYGLVIEPLYWIKPVSTKSYSWKADVDNSEFDNCGSGHGTLYQCKWHVYGTVTNWATWMMASSANYQEEIGHLSLHMSMAEAMFINSDIDYFTGGALDNGIVHALPDYLHDGDPGGESDDGRKDLTGSGKYSYRLFRERVSERSPSESHFAYGWHFIGAPSRAVSQQITWNATVPSPGPAPDPTGLPDPSKRTDGTPVPPDPDNGYPNGYPDKRFNIVKYYRTIVKTYENGVLIEEKEDATLREGPTIRRQNPNIIKVVDEPKYKVVDWYTTPSDSLPPENDKSQEYYTNKSAVSVVQNGTGPELVTLDKTNDNSERTLVVLLEKEIKKDISNPPPPPPPVYDGDIVINESQLYKTIHTASTEVKGTNPKWGHYSFKFKFTTFNPKTAIGYHSSVTCTPQTTAPSIPNCNNYTTQSYEDPYTTWYLDYVRDENGHLIYDAVNNEYKTKKVYYTAYRTMYTGATCNGHSHNLEMPGSSGDDKITFKFRGLHSISNGDVEIRSGIHTLTDPKVYSDSTNGDISSISKNKTGLDEESYSIGMNGNSSDGVDYVSVIWRVNDVPTLPTYKEADIRNRYGAKNWEVPSKLLHSALNIPSLTRQSNGKKTDTKVKIKFGVDQSLSDLQITASCGGVSKQYSDCFHTSSKNVVSDVSNGFNWDYDFEADVTTAVYRGVNKDLADMPFTGTSDTTKTLDGKKNYMYTIFQNSDKISFYPYIKMTFMTNTLAEALAEDNKDGKNRYNTYVFSEQLSEILPNDAVEVGWHNDGNGVMNLTSQQWSLHQKAINGSDGWQGKNQVLPGGALYTLDTDSDKTEVDVITYQTIVDTETRPWLASALGSDSYTESKAQSEHKSLIETAWDVLDNLKVVQWVNSNLSADTAWPKKFDESKISKEVKVTEGGQSLKALGYKSSVKTNDDDKYYLNKANEGSAASQGDLDILSARQTTIVYKVFSDTEGNVYLVSTQEKLDKLSESNKVPTGNYIKPLVDKLKDINADTLDSEDIDWSGVTLVNDSPILTKDKTYNDVIGAIGSFSDIKAMEEKTYFIRNFVKSLERNTGFDTTAAWATADGKWYNEAFDGAYIVVQKSTLKIGFLDPSKRSVALDPALCPENKGQSDLYTKAVMSQFCLDSKSDSALAQGKPEQFIGSFRGVDITLPNMQGMYTTRKFYIPNANVQDLN